MVKRGHLDVPVIGVAKAGWSLEQFRERARDSLEKHGGLDAAAFAKLLRPAALRRRRLRRRRPPSPRCASALGAAQRPAHYLAIPPALFATVVEQLAQAGCTEGARVVVEKPFGRDLARRVALNRDAAAAPSPKRTSSASTTTWARSRCRTCCYFRFANALPRAHLEPQLRRQRADHDGRGLRRAGPRRASTTTPARSATWCRTTCSRCCANLAMEPPVRTDSESIRDEKVKVLRAMRTLAPDDLVRGQFDGYRAEPGVAAGLAHRDLRRAAAVRSTPGAGRTCPSTSAPARTCRSPAPRCWCG